MVTERGGVGRKTANITQIKTAVSATNAMDDTARYWRAKFLRLRSIVSWEPSCNQWARIVSLFCFDVLPEHAHPQCAVNGIEEPYLAETTNCAASSPHIPYIVPAVHAPTE